MLLRRSGDLDLVCDLLLPSLPLFLSDLLLLTSFSFCFTDRLRLLLSSFLELRRSLDRLLLEDRLDELGLLLRLLLLPCSDFKSEAFRLSLESSLVDCRLLGLSSLLLLLVSLLPCFLVFSTVSLRFSASRTLPLSAALLKGEHAQGEWPHPSQVMMLIADKQASSKFMGLKIRQFVELKSTFRRQHWLTQHSFLTCTITLLADLSLFCDSKRDEHDRT